MALDERLRHDLERAGRLADPSGVYEELIRRRERRRIVRRVQSGALAVVVLAASVAGLYGLSRIFGPGGSTPGVDPSPFPIVPRGNGRITYSMSTNDGMELLSVLPDGSKPQVIPTPEGLPWLHSWSPDGTKIAVSVFPMGEGDRTIWVMNADGSDAVRVGSAWNVSVPSWSPDGTTIAYSARTDGRTEIHLVGADGSNDRVLHAENAEGTFAIFSAKFSPDGTEILFDRGTDSHYDIFVMDADGTSVRQLTMSGTDYDPHWSPDGTQITFTREEIVEVEGERHTTSDIFVMNADGTDVRRLTNGDARSTLLYSQWSPDGSKIAYLAVVTGGPGSLVVMDADGSDPITLVEGDVLGISWQPLPSNDVTIEPEPSQEPMGPGQQDIGLGYRVCGVSTVDASFLPGGTQTAIVGTDPVDGECRSLVEDATGVVGLDGNDDGLIDTAMPLDCQQFCSAFAAPDVDGDGTAELLVQNIQFSVAGLRLVDVIQDEAGLALIVPIVEPPGDPEMAFQGFDGSKEPQFWIGGDGFGSDALRCEAAGDGRVLVSSAAQMVPPDTQDSVWQIHETTFVLQGGVLRVIGMRDYEEPAFAGSGPTFTRTTGCGADLDPYG